MTLCPDCTARHRTDVEFAAAVIDSYTAGRYRSQAATDLRAMLPPKPVYNQPDVYATHPHQPHESTP